MEGFRVHHNLVRDHMALRTTPGSLAGLRKPDGCRWEEILRLATQPQTEDGEIRIVTVGSTPESGGTEGVGQKTPDN